MKTASLWISLLLASLLVPAIASAQGGADDGASLRAQASEHMKKGKQYQDIGDHAKAVGEFMAAYELLPHALILYNIGNAHRLAGNKGEAISYFEKFVALEPAGDPVDKAKSYLAALKPAYEADKADMARREEQRAADEADAKAKAAAAAKKPVTPEPPKSAETGSHFFVGLGLGANTCFEIGNTLCSNDFVSHAPSYAVTISPGYRFHRNVGVTVDIGIGGLSPVAEDKDVDEDALNPVSTLTMGTTLMGFVPVDPVEIVAGLGFGTMSISGENRLGTFDWSGMALKMEGGVVYGSMGGKEGLAFGAMLSYFFAQGGTLSGDGSEPLTCSDTKRKNCFEDNNPYYDLLQFSLAVSYSL
jgi:hypothetical protein